MGKFGACPTQSRQTASLPDAGVAGEDNFREALFPDFDGFLPGAETLAGFEHGHDQVFARRKPEFETALIIGFMTGDFRSDLLGLNTGVYVG